MHIYEQFQQKIAFSGPHIPLICSRSKTAVRKGKIFHNLPLRKCQRLCRAAADLLLVNLGKDLGKREQKEKGRREERIN